MSADLSSASQVLVAKQFELNQSCADIRTLKVQLESTTAQKTEAEELIKAEVKKSSDLNGLLSTFKEKLKSEREQGTVTMSGLSERDSVISVLTQEKSAIVAEVESLKSAHEIVEKKLRRSSMTLDEKTAMVSALSDDMNQAKERHSTVLVTMESEIKSLKLASENASSAAAHQLEVSQKAESKARDSIVQLTGSAVTAAADLAKLRCDIPILQSSLDKKVAELAQMKDAFNLETATLKKSLVAKEEAVTQFQKQITENENKLSILRQDHDDLQKKNDENLRLKQVSDESVASLNKDLKILSKKIDILESIKTSLSAEKENLIVKNNGAQQEQSKESESLNARIITLKSEIDSRNAELTESKNKIEKLNNEIRDVRATNVSTASDLKSQISALQNQKAEVVEKHEQYKTKVDKDVTILKKELIEKVSLVKEETNVILIEKKKEEETLVRKLDDTSKALTVLKKQTATLTTENLSTLRYLDKYVHKISVLLFFTSFSID